jgi:hypothetical protein
MTRNFTLFYLFSNTEAYPSEILIDDSNASHEVSGDIFAYFDKHLAEVSEDVVEKLIKFASDLSETSS